VAIDTILFDIGWPIIDESESHRAWNEYLRQRIGETKGRKVSDAEIKSFEMEAVGCYAPSMFSYVIWRLTGPEKELFYKLRAEFDNFDFYEYYRIQPEAIDLLARLHTKFKLGIAANQPKAVHKYLEEEGLLKFFDSKMVSDEIGYSKPDVRMFLKVLENLDSIPESSAMVGDRQDNDIIPAKLIGMKTIRLLIGPHRDQKVRYPNEGPDYAIDRLSDLLDIPFISNRLQNRNSL